MVATLTVLHILDGDKYTYKCLANDHLITEQEFHEAMCDYLTTCIECKQESTRIDEYTTKNTYTFTF